MPLALSLSPGDPLPSALAGAQALELTLTGDWPELPGELFTPMLRNLQITAREADIASVAGVERATGLSSLKLDLGPRGPAVLPDLRALTALKSLTLASGGLTELPPWIGELTTLRELRVYGSPRLDSLPSTLSGLKALEVLVLLGTALRSLPEELGQLESLKELAALRRINQPGALPLAEVPSSLGQLRALVRLNLQGNSIRSVPPEWAGMVRLEHLDLRENPIAELPDELGGLVRLRWLDLRKTAIGALPSCVARMPELERLQTDQLDLQDAHRELNRLPEPPPPTGPIPISGPGRLVERPGVVALWLGTGFEDDNDGVGWFDHDHAEGGGPGAPIRLTELLRGGSYWRSWAPAAVARAASFGVTRHGTWFGLFDYAWEAEPGRFVLDPEARDAWFLGNFPYAKTGD